VPSGIIAEKDNGKQEKTTGCFSPDGKSTQKFYGWKTYIWLYYK
jgi:hypothetical protein